MDIFVSYSRQDKNIVFPFVERIEKVLNITCWIDYEGIESGSQFEDVIVNAIESSKIVLFMLSDNSINSQWTKREVLYAENEGKKIVPIVIDGKGLRKWFKFHFGNVDYIDINEEEQCEKLLHNLAKWIGVKDTTKKESLSDDIVRECVENYGISIFSLVPSQNKMLIYYGGDIFLGNEIDIYGIRKYSQIKAAYDGIEYSLHKCNTKKLYLDSYLRSHKEEIEDSFNIVTYCCESDLLNILYKLRQNPTIFGQCRIVQEMQLLPLCHNCFKDEIVAYEYSNLYCEAESGGGVFEIIQTGFAESRKNYTAATHVKKLSLFESFVRLALSSIVQYHILKKDWEDNIVLLSTMPFEIKVEIWINQQYREGFTLIERNQTIPCKNTRMISDDDCSVVISFLGKRFSIDINDLFGYKPNIVILTVNIDQNTNIKYVFSDKETEFSISQTDIFNYEQ